MAARAIVVAVQAQVPGAGAADLVPAAVVRAAWVVPGVEAVEEGAISVMVAVVR